MSEKKKWFDPQQLTYPEPIQAVSDVTQEDAVELIEFFRQRKKWDAAARVFRSLLRMRPEKRLTTNLQTLLTLLAENNIRSVIPDGLTQPELDALITLQTHDVPQELQVTAQGLLNVYERYMLLASVGRMFRVEKARHWEVGL